MLVDLRRFSLMALAPPAPARFRARARAVTNRDRAVKQAVRELAAETRHARRVRGAAALRIQERGRRLTCRS
jgi:hypothetical protein